MSQLAPRSRASAVVLVVIALAAYGSAPAGAAPAASPTAPVATASAAPAALKPAEQAATDLLKIMGTDERLMDSATAMIASQIRSNPALEPYRDVILKWASRYLTWDELGPHFVKIYADAFTESELRDMIAFYKTPTGKKALTVVPDLMAKGMEYGGEVARKHQAELLEMIEQRQKELNVPSPGDDDEKPAPPSQKP